MILVTVGTQLPFDRLIRAVDAVMPSLGEQGIAQTGKSTYAPVHLKARASIDPSEFEQILAGARLVIAHAGVGTILMAHKHRRPLIIMPRRAGLGEHRNDHQLATAQALAGRGGIYIAEDEAALHALMAQPLAGPAPGDDNCGNRERLITSLADYIRNG